MVIPILKNELTFNSSFFKEHEANRWKFLDEIEAETQVGPFMRSPVIVLSCTLAYILFVCLIGPFLMKNREPFQLKNLIRLYNLFAVILAAVLYAGVYDAVGSLGELFDCRLAFNLYDESGTKIYQMGNFIILVRLSEYLDTIFFTLRKKQNQVTFLHVFHHAFVPIYAYWILRTAPLRFNVFIILVNSFIHILMYFYYFLATFQEPRDSSGKRSAKPSFLMLIVQKLLMFKRYMTQLQILQFVALACYAIYAYLQPNRCGVPMTYITANLLLAFGFLGLFVHFYLNVYKAGAKKARQE